MSIEDDTPLHEATGDALAPGSKLLSGQYEIQRYLSSGGFGITYLATDSLNRTVVIKECFPEAFCSRVNKTVRARTQNYLDDFRSIVRLFIKEAHALSRLDHPSVVGVHQVFEDNETAYMALDLIDGQDLLGVIESDAPAMSPESVRDLTLKLLDAIAHVHSQDLLHRDISPDNILVDKTGHPVLIDFGAAREEASRKSRVLSAVLVVKDGYSPQEFYVAGSQQLPCSDLYALAATLSHLITGEAPPNSQARLAALAANQPDPHEPLSGRFPEYDPAFLEAIDKALNIVPAERIQSAEEWTLAIDHRKRLELARAKAQADQSIDLTVMNLIKSTHTETGEDANKPLPKAEYTPKPKPRPQSTSPSKILLAALAEDDEVRGASATADTRDDQVACKVSDEIEVDDNNTLVAAHDHEPPKPTPYLRVTSRALEAKRSKEEETPNLPSPSRLRRLATVPVVFCAYFFYGHTILQYDQVHAATIEPLVALGENIGDSLENLAEPGSKPVTVRRGTGG